MIKTISALVVVAAVAACSGPAHCPTDFQNACVNDSIYIGEGSADVGGFAAAPAEDAGVAPDAGEQGPVGETEGDTGGETEGDTGGETEGDTSGGGNPGNDKGVGNAGENPNGKGGWGDGDKGKSDGDHGRDHGRDHGKDKG